MIVDITSFGWSGSGAYHDLLREYAEGEFPSKRDWEFTLLWDTDGIYDLENKICVKSCRMGDSDMAIRRFVNRVKILSENRFLGYKELFPKGKLEKLTNDYLSRLIGVEFYGRSFVDIVYPNRKEKYIKVYNKFIQKIFGNRITVKIFGLHFYERLQDHNPHLMRVAYRPDNFLTATQEYFADLIKETRRDSSKILVMDQMLPPDNPEPFYKYIKEDLKTIIIRRDPRDTYLAMKCSANIPFPIPSKNVEDFIWFYKNIVDATRLPDTDSRLSINFEDLIYEYEGTKKKIEDFLGLSNHISPKTKFNPQISINNTQLFNLYTDYKEDIAKIEEELKTSLYPFEKYSFNRTTNQVF